MNDNNLQQTIARFMARVDVVQVASEKKIAVALSGGGDSLALCLLLKNWCDQQKNRPTLVALHVNHGLRPKAGMEADILKQKMADVGIAFYQTTLENFSAGGNLHHRARERRYRALYDMAQATGARVVFLGHQENDVAENLVIRLSRRAGLRGLAAMKDRVLAPLPCQHDEKNLLPLLWLRPLLLVERKDLQHYLQQQKIDYFNDDNNNDDKYLRSRVRKAVEWLAEKNILSAGDVAQSARYLRMADDFLSETCDEKKSSVMTVDRAMVRLSRKTADGGDVHPYLLHYWLSRVMAWWQGDGFSPPSEKILSCHDNMVLSYPHYWVMTTTDNIVLIKKNHAVVEALPAKQKILWQGCYHIHNQGDADLWVRPLGRGKKFLQKEFGKNFIGAEEEQYIPHVAKKYFYQAQPMIFWSSADANNKNASQHYSLPSLSLGQGRQPLIDISPYGF